MARLALLLFAFGTLVTASQSQMQYNISETLAGENVSNLEARDSSSTQPPTETGRIIPGVSSYAFTPFPTPSQVAKAGIFVPTDPKNPPPVSSDPAVLPDFEAAWTAAYKKATIKVRFLLPFDRFCYI